jgi:xanthine dehydrogenase small subunit
MVRFLLNNQLVETTLPPATTLLDFVRYQANLRGTKIGCREGDCGTCTVLVGSLIGNEVGYQSFTSCLTPLANIAGKHVVTIEGLNMQELNAVQEAMVCHSGTQCGFCTPGFVVSLCGFALQTGEEPEFGEAIDAMDGNICRCTGYKSIERAAATITAKLQQKNGTPSLEWLVNQGFVPAYFHTVGERLASMAQVEMPNGQIPIGGGTDLYVQQHDNLHQMPLKFVLAGKKTESIQISQNECIIPGKTPVTELMRCGPLQAAIPGWTDYLKLVSSTPIRNMATVAGNLVNASPIGDLTILLLALDARITLENKEGNERTIRLRDFYLGYKKLDKSTDEILTQIAFNLPDENHRFHFEKVCKRMYLDIASVNTAIGLTVENDTILAANCSMGGVAPVPLFLHKTSRFLTGQKITTALVQEAAGVLATEIAPISDVRGSAAYKQLLARQLFYSHFLTLFPHTNKMHDLI